jgi:hypothetical protein
MIAYWNVCQEGAVLRNAGAIWTGDDATYRQAGSIYVRRLATLATLLIAGIRNIEREDLAPSRLSKGEM